MVALDCRPGEAEDGRSEASSCSGSLDSRSLLTHGAVEGYEHVIKNPLARDLSAGPICHDPHNVVPQDKKRAELQTAQFRLRAMQSPHGQSV